MNDSVLGGSLNFGRAVLCVCVYDIFVNFLFLLNVLCVLIFRSCLTVEGGSKVWIILDTFDCFVGLKSFGTLTLGFCGFGGFYALGGLFKNASYLYSLYLFF